MNRAIAFVFLAIVAPSLAQTCGGMQCACCSLVTYGAELNKCGCCSPYTAYVKYNAGAGTFLDCYNVGLTPSIWTAFNTLAPTNTTGM